jgi:heme-degrading monooxygenase HmoA
MWVRIDEIAFARARTDEVIDHVRNTAASKHEGEGFRGFRLLVDRTTGHALDVSYWDTEAAAAQGGDGANGDGMTQTIRSNVYEPSIDAV